MTEDQKRGIEINVDTTFGDTSSVSFVLSGIEYIVNYYEKRPQSIRVRRFLRKDSTILSYERDNRGIFMVFNDSLEVKGFGCKYLYENQIVNLQLDSLKRADYVEIGNGGYSDGMRKIYLNSGSSSK